MGILCLWFQSSNLPGHVSGLAGWQNAQKELEPRVNALGQQCKCLLGIKMEQKPKMIPSAGLVPFWPKGENTCTGLSGV